MARKFTVLSCPKNVIAPLRPITVSPFSGAVHAGRDYFDPIASIKYRPLAIAKKMRKEGY
jgi:hypothetical protein